MKYEQLVKEAKSKMKVGNIELAEGLKKYLKEFAVVSAEHEAHGIKRLVNPTVAKNLKLTRQYSNYVLTRLCKYKIITKDKKRLTELGKKLIEK